MTSRMMRIYVCLFGLFACYTPAAADPPPIIGSPRIDRPPLLNWPDDQPTADPDLTEPTANTLNDLHAGIDQCGIVLSTAGNYHMALRDLWFNLYLPHVADLNLKNWFYTTSPPVVVEQITAGHIGIGNFRSSCRPQVAVGPLALMQALQGLLLTDGDAVPIIQNRGNVILVKNGNPKNILSIWDLGRSDVRVVTSNPDREPGSFNNYKNSIYNIAANDRGTPAADTLFNTIFNDTIVPNKWLAGHRIHHREVPWSIALGHADASLMFYHLALYTTRAFPNRFDIVPLGGTVDLPQPLPGNPIAVLYAVKVRGDWTPNQIIAAERLMKAFQSVQFGNILARHGFDRPLP